MSKSLSELSDKVVQNYDKGLISYTELTRDLLLTVCDSENQLAIDLFDRMLDIRITQEVAENKLFVDTLKALGL